MMGRLNREQRQSLYSFGPEEAVPDDRRVREIAAVLDLGAHGVGALFASRARTILGIYLFIVHLLTSDHRSSTGLLLAPRGLGTMLAMVLTGRLTSRVDPRLLMFAGVLMICASMWSMVGWTPDVDAWSLALTTFTQGVGLGFVFIPLQVVAFATLPADLCGDGTASFSLIRNVGSGLGICISSFLSAQTIQIMHARIVEDLTPFNRMLQTVAPTFSGTAPPSRPSGPQCRGNAPSLNHRQRQ
jgi:MFS family permease